MAFGLRETIHILERATAHEKNAFLQTNWKSGPLVKLTLPSMLTKSAMFSDTSDSETKHVASAD